MKSQTSRQDERNQTRRACGLTRTPKSAEAVAAAAEAALTSDRSELTVESSAELSPCKRRPPRRSGPEPPQAAPLLSHPSPCSCSLANHALALFPDLYFRARRGRSSTRRAVMLRSSSAFCSAAAAVAALAALAAARSEWTVESSEVMSARSDEIVRSCRLSRVGTLVQ